MELPPSLSDIARELSLDKSTVSRALRNDSRVNKDTAQRIQKLAQKLGYQRSPLYVAMSEIAQRKGGNRSLMNWALILPEYALSLEGNRIMRELLARYAHEAGYELSIILIKPETTTRELRRLLKARNIRGMLINEFARHEKVLNLDLKELENAVEACVYCGHFFYEPVGNCVVENTFTSTILSLGKMAERGFQRIALLYASDFRDSRDVVRQRAAAYVFNEDHPEVEVFPQAITLNDNVDSFSGADALLISHGVKVKRLPEQLKKLPYAVLRVYPGLTEISGICRLHEDLASTAVDMLDMQLRCRMIGIRVRPHTILVEGRWQDGVTLSHPEHDVWESAP